MQAGMKARPVSDAAPLSISLRVAMPVSRHSAVKKRPVDPSSPIGTSTRRPHRGHTPS
jgi:hypothetical protein